MNDLNTNENVIEFLKDQKVMTCTFSQGRFITKVKRLAEKYPEEVEIVARNNARNNDGSIVAHNPVSYLKLSNKSRTLTDEQRAEMAERFRINELERSKNK
jgi:hypothetical protein